MDKINVGELFGKSVDDLQIQAEIQSLKNRNYQLQCEMDDYRNYIKHLESQIDQLTETKKEVRYKVVRSYTSGSTTKESDLKQAFNDGYEFVRASEVVENSKGYVNYIEYILRKEIEENENK